MQALSEIVASGGAAGLDGQQILLRDIPRNLPPSGLTPVSGRAEIDPAARVDGLTLPGLRWVMEETPQAASHSWTLTQGAAALKGVTVRIPEGGRLYVQAAEGTWQDVCVRGVILPDPQFPVSAQICLAVW